MKLTLVLLSVVIAYAAAQCTKTTLVTTENTACQGTTGNVCVSELSCIGASGTTSGTCKLQAIVGDACTSDTDCTNSFYNQFCSSNKCAIKFKNAGASCTVNGECSSNSCVSGSCAALQVGSPCSLSGFCGSPTNALFCTTNATCAATAASGAACGTINNVFVQCTPGFYCVGSGTSGTCTAPAAENAVCATSATFGTGIWANPGCSNANSALQCLSSKCVAASANIAIGQPCGTTDIVNAGKNCNPRESFCLGNVCTAFSSVSCNSVLNCGLVGVCNCQSDLTKNGTCAANPYSTAGCNSQALRYADCQATANTQNLINLCGDKQKAYRCCVRNLNLVSGKDLSLAYCSSATVAQVSIFIMAVVVALFF